MGDCASFAIAFQREYGGELYALYRRGKSLHTYVKHNNRNFDVKGLGTVKSMVRSMTGSTDITDWEEHGPFTPETQPNKKPTDKKIAQALEYIRSNKRRFDPSKN